MGLTTQANHCFYFESDFVGSWRCIPLCVRRKLDLIGLKLKLSHWLALTHPQRQELVDWRDDSVALEQLRVHLQRRTQSMSDGMAKDLPPAQGEPWQSLDVVPQQLREAGLKLNRDLSLASWVKMSELERFALCKLARPGHDHHNLAAAFNEVLG